MPHDVTDLPAPLGSSVWMSQPGIELRHLRYFLAVAECCHFSRAAENVGIAQPALSQQVIRLEEALGVKLFDRANKRVSLTPAGEVFVGEAQGVLVAVHRGIDTVRRVSAGEADQIRLGYPSSVGSSLLPALVRRFRQRCPAVGLTVVETVGDAVWPRLQDGSLDAALVLGNPTPAPGAGIAPLCELDVVAVVPSGHAFATRGAIRAPEVCAERFVASEDPGSPAHLQHVHQLIDPDCVVRVTQRVTSAAAQLALVAANLGVSFSLSCELDAAPPGVAPVTLAVPSAMKLGLAVTRCVHRPAVGELLSLLRALTSEPAGRAPSHLRAVSANEAGR
jgi:DNA-binding transcriptional LysR family regulator